jgi:drug/metabolite transporter (DMT)-like permease
MKILYGGLIALGLALTELALLPVVLSIGGSGIGVVPQLFYAFLIGTITSLVVSYAVDRMAGLMKILRSGRFLLIIVVAGLLNNVISQLMLGVGTLGTNPIVAATVFRVWVIMSAVLVPLVLRQKVTKVQLLATIIGFAGIYVIATGGTLLSINASSVPYVAILLGSALCVVYPNLAMKKYNVDVFGAIAIFNMASLAFILAIALATGTSVLVPLNESVIIAVLFLGIAAYGIGSSLYYYALKTFGPLFIGNSILAVPFLTILFSALILDTPVHLYYIAAAVLLSAGIFMQQRLSKAPEHIKKRHSLADELRIFDVTSAFVNNRGDVISRLIEGDNKAFAIKINGHEGFTREHSCLFDKYGCVAFTNTEAHSEVRKKELDFVNEIMDAKPGETVVIGIGSTDGLERSFSEYARTVKPRRYAD